MDSSCKQKVSITWNLTNNCRNLLLNKLSKVVWLQSILLEWQTLPLSQNWLHKGKHQQKRKLRWATSQRKHTDQVVLFICNECIWKKEAWFGKKDQCFVVFAVAARSSTTPTYLWVDLLLNRGATIQDYPKYSGSFNILPTFNKDNREGKRWSY